MNDRKRVILFSIFILFATSLGATSLAIGFLYGAALREERARLTEVVQSQARIIEAIARFNTRYDEKWPNIAYTATISQIRDAHSQYVHFGRTGEFVLARRDGDSIVFVFRHRYAELDSPEPISFSSDEAQPTRMALSGRSGTMIGKDYRGVTVLAAYGPVDVLDLGIVAKIELAEVREPFIKAALWAGGAMLLLVFVGSLLFLASSNPIIRRLEEGEVMFRRTFDQSPIGAAILNLDYEYERVNAEFCRITGYSEDELLNKSAFSDITHPDDVEADREQVKALHSGRIDFYQRVKRYVRKDGGVVWVRLSERMVRDASGQPLYYLPMMEDISDQKRYEDALRNSEARFRTLTTLAPVGIFMTNTDGDCLYVNEHWCEIAGMSPEQAAGRGWLEALHPDDRQAVTETWYQFVRTGGRFAMEYRFQTPRGRVTWVVGRATSLANESGDIVGFMGTLSDFTERKKAEDRIRLALEEKEVLLREVHHRVKNNMQVVCSLLNLQSKKLDSDRMRSLFQESHNRIRAMAMIHENLYQSDTLAEIDLGKYLARLIGSLFMTYDAASRDIDLRIEAESVTLGIDLAVPCGLAVNEIITNSLKYAFPNGLSGEIVLQGRRVADGRIELVVTDNGVGFTLGPAWRESGNLGLPLVAGLVERQLRGELDIRSDRGTRVTMTFDDKPEKEEA